MINMCMSIEMRRYINLLENSERLSVANQKLAEYPGFENPKDLYYLELQYLKDRKIPSFWGKTGWTIWGRSDSNSDISMLDFENNTFNTGRHTLLQCEIIFVGTIPERTPKGKIQYTLETNVEELTKKDLIKQILPHMSKLLSSLKSEGYAVSPIRRTFSEQEYKVVLKIEADIELSEEAYLSRPWLQKIIGN